MTRYRYIVCVTSDKDREETRLEIEQVLKHHRKALDVEID